MYIIGIVLFPLYKKWPRLRSQTSFVGLPLVAISVISASFSTKVWHLILTQGVTYGVGGALLYFPCLLFLDEWFVQKKGLAFGIMWAGSGVAGLVMPFAMSSMLAKYGFRTTLRAWSVAVTIITLPLLYFLRPRLPISYVINNPRLDLSFLKSPTFWFLQAGNIAEALGFFIPQTYLPTYSASLNLPTSNGTLLLSLVSTSSVISAILTGLLIDRLHVTTVILISTLGATTSILLVWGFSSSLPLLIIFALLYGLFAGGFSCTYTGIIKEIKRENDGADVGILIGLLSAGRGFGAVISGPLSEALLRSGPLVAHGAVAYGGGYGSLIVFTGFTTAVGGVSFLGRRMGWL
jgi:MFS family permease